VASFEATCLRIDQWLAAIGDLMIEHTLTQLASGSTGDADRTASFAGGHDTHPRPLDPFLGAGHANLRASV